jgi:hypothetical protein
MPIDSNVPAGKERDVLSRLIKDFNRLEADVKDLKAKFPEKTGDYATSTLLGVKTEEGKFQPYTAAQVKTLLGI